MTGQIMDSRGRQSGPAATVRPVTSPSYMPGSTNRPARRFGLGAVLGALVAGLLFGAGSGYASAALLGDDAPVEAAAIEPAPQDSATSALPSAPADDDRQLALGKVWTFDNGAATTVVLRYKANISEAQEGERLHGIEVRTCITKTADRASSVSSGPWSLADGDGGNFDLLVSGAVAGEYPAGGKTVEPGRCVKGWVVISAPKDAKPTLAVYESDGNRGRPAEWQIG